MIWATSASVCVYEFMCGYLVFMYALDFLFFTFHLYISIFDSRATICRLLFLRVHFLFSDLFV